MRHDVTPKILTLLLCLTMPGVAGSALRAAPAAGAPAAPRRLGATAEFSSPQEGTRTIQVGIVIDHLTDPQEIDRLKKTLEEGGQHALKSAIGSRADGRLKWGPIDYPLNVVAATPSGDGYRYAVVTARPIMIHERDTEQESLDYPFAVLLFEVDADGRGEGDLYETAALSVDENGEVGVESYGGRTGRLTGIAPQR